MNFTEEIEYAVSRLETAAKELRYMMAAKARLDGVDLSDVSYSYSGDKSISLQLDGEKRGSKLPHKVAQKLKIKLEKEKSWHGDSLIYKGETEDGFKVEIHGAVPTTCKLVEVEEPLTPEEIKEATAKAIAEVKTVRVRREVVCK